jgi:tetratricopeptide (TPR) repeat protein
MTDRLTIVICIAVLQVGWLPAAEATPGPQTAPAAGEERFLERAKALYIDAEKAFSLGQFDRALRLYKRAFALKDLPGFLFNIGQCHFNLGDYRRARFFYERYLARQPNPPNRDIVEKLIQRANAALEKQRESGQPERDGETVAEAPEQQAAMERERQGRLAEQREATGSTRPILFWSGVGLASALALSGIVTGALVLDRKREYDDSNTPLQRQLDLADSGRKLRTATNVLFGVSAAVAVGSGLYYWLSRPSEAKRPNERASLRLSATPATRGALIVGQGHF